jgi:hypothetical protein
VPSAPDHGQLSQPADPPPALPRRGPVMLDIAYIAIVLVFFALAALTVRACERL